jgi:hypothetical protein
MRSNAFENQNSLWANILVHKFQDMDIADRRGKLLSKTNSITERMGRSGEKVASKALGFLTSFREVEDEVE